LIAGERYDPPGFKAALGYKDVGLALEAAQTLEVNMPLANLIAGRFLTLIEAGGADLDWSAIALLAKRESGAPTVLDPEHHPEHRD